jgi:Mrp family chromosome partitioning ATPase
VDGVILVVQHRSYPRAVSLRAKNMVENVGGNLIGVVLNNLNVTRDYYYYYHSDYSGYAYGASRKDKRQEQMAAGQAAPAPTAEPARGAGAAT